MPCATDYRYEDDRELQRVTRVACDMAKVLTHGRGLYDLTQETKDWIREHNEEDERRRNEDAQRLWERIRRKEIISQMSPETRRILGLE